MLHWAQAVGTAAVSGPGGKVGGARYFAGSLPTPLGQSVESRDRACWTEVRRHDHDAWGDWRGTVHPAL